MSRKKILIADEDALTVKLAIDTLSAQGHKVLTAVTGEKTMEILKKERPHLLFMNINLPGRSGRRVCQELKSDPKLAYIPVIIIIDREDEDSRLAGFRAGGMLCLAKPMNSEKLAELTQAILHR